MDIQDFKNIKTNIPDANDLIYSKKKKKRNKSLFNLQEVPEQQIQVPQSISELQQESVVQEIIEQQTIEQQKQMLIDIANQQKTAEQYTPEQIQEVKEILQQNTESIIPDEVDVIELNKEVVESLNNTPDGSDFDLSDVQIKTADKPDKTGYYKTKVNIKKNNIPEQINVIASYVKQFSKGLVSPRVCDLRTIGNTNKTQLRGSKLKLSVATVIFKPNPKRLKVNKGTRFMISVPEDYSTTGNLLVYIQESRAKDIIELTSKDFTSINHFNEFIGDRIVEYYTSGYDIVSKKLQLRDVDNPLMGLLTEIVRSKEFRGKPILDNNGKLYSIVFETKNPDYKENHWLHTVVTEVEQGLYDVEFIDKVDSSWSIKATKTSVSLSKLKTRLFDLMVEAYSKEYEHEGLDKIYYDFEKIKHNKLKQALLEINQSTENYPERGIVIKRIMSKEEAKKLLPENYDAEAIIGITNKLEFWSLTYLAHQIVGGDKRKGRDYITTDQYYEKYSVNDRRDYQEREKTVIKKEGKERNYNSRIYIFQLEYTENKADKNSIHIFRSKNFQDVIEMTGFLNEDIKYPKSLI